MRTPLDINLIRAAAPQWRVDVVEETGSTNADLLARPNIAGSVLLAEYQTAGRGRHGRQWSAPPRSQVAMSVGVDTTGIPTDTWGWLPLLTGVAAVDVVRESLGVADLGHRTSIAPIENLPLIEHTALFRKCVCFCKFSVQACDHWEYCLHQKTEAATGHLAADSWRASTRPLEKTDMSTHSKSSARRELMGRSVSPGAAR